MLRVSSSSLNSHVVSIPPINALAHGSSVSRGASAQCRRATSRPADSLATSAAARLYADASSCLPVESYLDR